MEDITQLIAVYHFGEVFTDLFRSSIFFLHLSEDGVLTTYDPKLHKLAMDVNDAVVRLNEYIQRFGPLPVPMPHLHQ